MKYKPSRDIPKFAREHQTIDPEELQQLILRFRNKEVKVKTVYQWLRRHPKIHEELRKGVVKEQIGKQEVSESIFSNGTFESFPMVKQWIKKLKGDGRADEYIRGNINALKKVCRGRFTGFGVDLVKEGLWCLKHPERLTEEEALDIVLIMQDRGYETYGWRMTLRNFFSANGKQAVKLRGGKQKNYGNYASMYVERERLDLILSAIRTIDYEAYLASSYMFFTATRVTATLNALNIKVTEHQSYAKSEVIDKGKKTWRKTLKGSFYFDELKPFIQSRKDVLYRIPRKVVKDLDPEVQKAIKPYHTRGSRYPIPRTILEVMDQKIVNAIKPYKKDTIFRISKARLTAINKDAITSFCPDLLERYDKINWNHFWRHMFAQHMLLLTSWNYAVVAFLGGWKVQTLQDNYGKPTEEQVKEWGVKVMPQL